jgi:aryl sulfotransferase
MRTLWLASYPKSGNTWMRMMIGALAAPESGNVSINDLPEQGGMASSRLAFDFHTLIDSSLLTYDEIDCLRPAVYALQATGLRDEDDRTEALAAGAKARFVKTHDAYTRLRDGTPLLGGRRSADGAVLIVRDPRDVAPSFAHHNGVDLDEAIARMADPACAVCAQPDRAPKQLRQQLLSWSAFIESWLAQDDLPTIVVRYEDMRSDPVATLARVMDFADDPQPAAALAHAARLTEFTELKRLEVETGFREASPRAKGGFFRRGQAGAWKDELTPDQVARIEAAQGAMMRRLGYEPVGSAEFAGMLSATSRLDFEQL